MVSPSAPAGPAGSSRGRLIPRAVRSLLSTPCARRIVKFNHKYELEHIFSFGAALESPPEAIGPVAEGIRVNFYCQGGEVTGPKLQGRCRSVGGDWLTIRTDGVAILDVRTTLESHDGALIAITYSGVTDLGNDGY